MVRLPPLTAEQTRRPEYFRATRHQRGLFMPKQEQQGQGQGQEGDGETVGEVEGPFDPDPELRATFGDREAAGAGMGARLPPVGVARVGATRGRFRALAPILKGTVATDIPTGLP